MKIIVVSLLSVLNNKKTMKTTKKLGLAILFIALFSMTYAQDCGYFPVNKGASMTYETRDGKDKITGTNKTTIIDVVDQPVGTIFKVLAESWDAKNKQVGSNEYAMRCEGGNFIVEAKSLIDSKTLGQYKDMEVEISGVDITYPNALAVGTKLPDAQVTLTAKSGGVQIINMTISLVNRQIVAQESVTTPAGTFSCYKLTYDVNTKMMFSFSAKVTEWLNKGAGTVKSETYDSKGKLASTMVLTEFKP